MVSAVGAGVAGAGAGAVDVGVKTGVIMQAGLAMKMTARRRSRVIRVR
jgi:hypothetical protein